MAVFRVERNTGYTVMSNHHLRNKELSLKAKGLLSQMLSLPEDWDYTLAGLSHINREKIDAIREAVKELEKAGYIVRSRERDEKGRLRGADYVIYEQPQPREPEAATSVGQPPILDLPALENPTLENPTLEKPTQEKPTLENPTQLNKDISSKEKSITDLSSTHTVEWWNTKERYDLVYKSRVFTDTYSKDTITVTNAEQVIFGGTGYDTKNRLPPEVEHSYPDYSIYPQFFGIAYGFLSRGCPRNCGFCIASGKEGRKSVKVADLSEFWKWQPEIKIMDANLLACPDHENLIEQLIRSRAWVDFSQGLDIRLVNRDNVSLLNRVRIKAVHFAWDNPDEDLTGYFQRFLDLTAIKSSRQRRVYVLTNYGSTHEQDLYRVNTLRAMGFDPYVMIYERPTAPPVTRHLQRWVNNKRLFYAVPRFEDYIPGRKEV